MAEISIAHDRIGESLTEGAMLRAELARLRAELGAVRSEEIRLREAVASVGELIAVIAGDGEVIALNRAGREMLGRADDEASRLSIADILAAEDARRLIGEIGPALSEPRARWSGELRLRRADGTLLVTEQVIRPIFQIGGQVGGRRELLLVARLQAAARRAEDEQERLLARLRSLTAVLENTSDFVAMADTEGRILYVNPAGMSLVGRSGEDPLSLRVSDLQAPRDYESLITDIFPFVRAHGSWLGELFLWHADGSEIPVSQVITVVRNELGEHVGYATISRDITELKRSEAERQKAVEAAEAANRAKTVFLANMSHELRTPLNAILGFAQLLIRGKGLTAEQEGHLEVINRSGEHLLALINDVLEMSKIEAGRLTLNVRAFDPRRLFADLEDMLRLRVAEKGLYLSIDVEPEVDAELLGDPAKLRQVTLNLLSNAIKFTDRGGIALRSGLRREGNGELRLWIEVEDSGRGIAAEELPRLFRPFEQTRSGRASQEGTGLGLTISQHFVRMMGGEIQVRSGVGIGTCFSFEVAVGRAAAADERGLLDDHRQVVGLAPGQPRWRVLIVEDRWQNRELLRSILEPLGFEVREAINGEEAVEVARGWRPHLIWMDIRMPVMDGYEATRRIKALPGGRDVVVVAISANVFEDDRRRMAEAGAADFVAKPFSEQDITSALVRHLGCRFVLEEAPKRRSASGDAGWRRAARETSASWREALAAAAAAADAERLAALTDSIRAAAPALAERMSAAIGDFDYDLLLEIAAGGGHG
ncbi:MAG: response regulator [Myxococcales bacterium]|nr:response regulator [Myxococcales bacterium]